MNLEIEDIKYNVDGRGGVTVVYNRDGQSGHGLFFGSVEELRNLQAEAHEQFAETQVLLLLKPFRDVDPTMSDRRKLVRRRVETRDNTGEPVIVSIR